LVDAPVFIPEPVMTTLAPMRGSPEDLSVIFPVKLVCWQTLYVKPKMRMRKIFFI
jgi:hypothetical protein